MKTTTDDLELFATMRRELFTAVVGDVMDALGLRHQFLSPMIRPLRDDMVVVGRAMTVQEADLPDGDTGDGAGADRQPFGLMLRALDDLKPGEVYLCTGASPTYALWGELMATRAMRLGAAGAVVDGYSRDTRELLGLGFPVFSHGRFAQDQGPRGHVVDFRCPLRFGHVRVADGDLVFGDIDGVCVVPREAEAEVIAAALLKARGERTVRSAIREGMSASAAFERYGIM